jgi:hypothetical protein
MVYRLTALAGGGYLLALIVVSLLSRERLLAPGDALRFCGLYLDCHRMVTVESVRYVDTVGGHSARGRHAVVRVRLMSDATGVTLGTGHLAATLRGSGGRTYHRDHAAERALAAGGTPAGLPTVPLPAGTPVRSTIVFKVPDDEPVLHLRIRDAGLLPALTEFFLIGDADSFLHRRAWFVLDAPDRIAFPATPRRLCGGIGGCDTVVRVVDVRHDAEAGVSPPVPADGVFYLVTLAVTDADSGAPRSVSLVAEVRDGLGRSYGRAWDVERLLIERRATPGIMQLAFDLPDDVPAPQLVVRRSGLLGRIVGAARIPLPGPGAL